MKRIAAFVVVVAFVFAACSSTQTATNGGDGDGGGTGDSGSTWCELARQLDEDGEKVALAFFDSGSTATLLKDLFAQFNSVVDEALAVAPSEIKADVEAQAAMMQEIEAEYAKVDYSVAQLQATNPNAFDRFNTPEIAARSQRIADYNERVCGISQEEEIITP